jgi:hypothetical protein
VRDRREEILARLTVIIGEVPGVFKGARNQQQVSGKAQPTIFLHDASEEPREEPNVVRASRNGYKDLVLMSPQIFILMGTPAADIGTAVNAFRIPLVAAVLGDSALWDIVGPNGEIRYAGCGLETAWGESREGRLDVNFHITYVLDLAELS